MNYSFVKLKSQEIQIKNIKPSENKWYYTLTVLMGEHVTVKLA